MESKSIGSDPFGCGRAKTKENKCALDWGQTGINLDYKISAMNLFILRHGLAVEPGTPGYENDAERPLTSEGKSKLRQIAAAMEELRLDFDIILSSPFKRARQTAEIVAEELKIEDTLEFSDSLTPQGKLSDLVEHVKRLKPLPENIMLVGHEPYLSELISLLVCGSNNSVVVLKKGGFAKLTVTTLGVGRCAQLEWLLTPKQMGLMGN